MLKERIILKINGIEIPIEIKRFHNSKRLRIFGKGNNIRVTTNNFVSKKRITEIVKENKEIIYNNYVEGIKEELEIEAKYRELKFHYYLVGEKYNIIILKIQGTKNRTYLHDQNVVLELAQEVNHIIVQQLLHNLQKNLSEIYLPEHFELELDSFPYEVEPQLVIKKMIRQWGNCKKNRPLITLNSHLIKLPSELIHYVIFHELAHLIHPNHGKEFYGIIEHRFPHRKELDKELKRWAFVLKDNLTEEFK